MTNQQIKAAINTIRANLRPESSEMPPAVVDAVFFLVENVLCNLQDLADEARARRLEP